MKSMYNTTNCVIYILEEENTDKNIIKSLFFNLIDI
jgi:hypothetical protein